MGATAKDTNRRPPIRVKVGEVCNVRRARYHEPLMRRVTKTEWTRDKQGTWFFWYWEPQSHADGRRDCGYSGVLVEAA